MKIDPVELWAHLAVVFLFSFFFCRFSDALSRLARVRLIFVTPSWLLEIAGASDVRYFSSIGILLG